MDKNLYVYDSGNNKQVRLVGESSGQLAVNVKNSSLTVDASGNTVPVDHVGLTSLDGAIASNKLAISNTALDTLETTVNNGELKVSVQNTNVEVQSNNKNLVTEDTVTGMRDSSTTSVHTGTVATTEYTSTALDAQPYTMCALYMNPSTSTTATVQLQYSPDATTWFTIHEEVFDNSTDNQFTIRDLAASNVRLRIVDDASNIGDFNAWITLSRT